MTDLPPVLLLLPSHTDSFFSSSLLMYSDSVGFDEWRADFQGCSCEGIFGSVRHRPLDTLFSGAYMTLLSLFLDFVSVLSMTDAYRRES